MLHDGELLFHIDNLASGDHDFSGYNFGTEEKRDWFYARI